MVSLEIYVPMDRRQSLARGIALPDRTVGAALFADISGFTPLTEALIQELGPQRGPEEVIGHLNRVYDALIAEVHRYGGSVIGFAGDSITCWLDGDNGRRGAACALAMQERMTAFEAVLTPAGVAFPLGIKVSVTAGRARRFRVGHPRIQVKEVLAGSILDRMAAAEGQLRQGEVIVGAEVMGWLGNQAVVQEWRPDPSGEHFAVITGLAEPVPPAPWPEVPALSAGVARDWLLPPVYQRLQRGEGEYLAELRPAVPLFLQFSGIDYDQDDEAGEKLDAYVRWVQTVLARYGGYLIQLTIGDKGSYLYSVFGAPVAHDDDPLRAVATALDLRTAPEELGFIRDVRIGLTYGQMRTGAYGGSARRTYGVFGSETNIAARLMTRAEPGQVMISGRIAQVVAHGYDVQELGVVSLKGLVEPLPVYAVRGRLREGFARALKGHPLAPIVGREAERVILAERLRATLEGRGSSIVVEGEAGIGKSRLVLDLIGQARRLGIPVLVGAGDAIERATAYHAWRPVFRTLFGLDEEEDADAIRQRVLAQLGEDTYLVGRIPLLNAVLPLNMPDNALTAQMEGELRASNTRDALVRVLDRSPRAVSALLLVLEDAHWLDSASWALMAQMRREIAPLLLVVVTRPILEGAPRGARLPDEYVRLLAAPDTQHIRLATLSPEQTLALVCRRLGVTHLPAPVADLVREQAEGHPFFSEEIAYALRDAGLIHVADGECRLAVEAEELHKLGFPDTIQGVITSRIDRLPPEQQLALKVASVIGRVFPFRTLHGVYPVEADKAHLADDLVALARLEITSLESLEPELTYVFKHILTHEVAYGLLLYAQRQRLHRAVAEWLERAHADDLSRYYSLLAYHWSQVLDTQQVDPPIVSKTIEYSARAGERALRDGAYREAADYLSRAIDLAEEWGGGGTTGQDDDTLSSWPTPRSLAYWHRLLGEARHGLGQPAESREHFHQALVLLGYPGPSGALRIGLLWQVLRFIGRRVLPLRSGGRSSEAKASSLEAAHVCEHLVQIHYLANEWLLELLAVFHGFDLAERAGPSPQLARYHALLSAVARTFRLHRLARVYRRRAQRAVLELNDLPALAWVSMVHGLWGVGFDPWVEILDALGRAIALYKHLGDRRGWGDSLSALGWVRYLQARFAEGVDVYEELYTIGVASDNVEHQVFGLNGQAMNLLRLGRTDQAVARLEAAGPRIAEIAQSRISEIQNHSMMSVACLRQDRLQEAREMADQVASLLRQGLPTSFALFDCYIDVARVYLTVWEAAVSSGSDGTQAKLKSAAKGACKALRRYAWWHPVGRPRAWLYRGCLKWLSGRRNPARRDWDKGLAHATRLAMPYEEGLARYEIGRHLPADDPARQEHLRQAEEIFTRLGAAYDRERAEAELHSGRT